MAARPSPRPVRPSPSVVVADTDTGAPTAAESAASASARRGPIFGLVADHLYRHIGDRPPVVADTPDHLGQQRDA